MRICCSSWSQGSIELPLWTDATEMQDFRTVTVLCLYYRSTFGGQRWLVRCGNPLGPVHIAYSMRVACLRWPYTLLWPLLPWISYMLILLAQVTALDLNQWPRVANIFVFKDHFMKHVLEYVTPNQTAKTITRCLYQGYISIFGAQARLLSDRGVNFMSSLIDEMFKILAAKKLQTTPYHPQTNGLVERLHQTIIRMIEKLGKDKKANWSGHLAEIVQAYNATHSAMTGYSPHYLMFRQRPRLPVDFYFPTFMGHRGPHERGLCLMCWSIHSFCSRSIEDHPSRGTDPIDGRSAPTKMVLWP